MNLVTNLFSFRISAKKNKFFTFLIKIYEEFIEGLKQIELTNVKIKFWENNGNTTANEKIYQLSLQSEHMNL